MTLHAYVDESNRGSYMICVVLAEPKIRRAIQQSLRGLLLGSQERLHIKNESKQRQRLILSHVSQCEVSAMLYTTTRKPIREGRAEIFRRMTSDLLSARVDLLVLESQVGQDALDRQVIYDALGKARQPDDLLYRHALARSEPLLWLPDAIAWAYGKGGQWRAHIANVVDHVIEVP